MTRSAIVKPLFYLLRRAILRTIGLFGYSEVAERAGFAGIHDAIWNEGYFWPFVLIGTTISVLIDLLIQATSPDFTVEEKSCETGNID